MYAEQKSKACTKCAIIKDFSEFYVGTKGYFYGACKQCMCKKSRQYFSENKKRVVASRAEYQREYLKKNEDKARENRKRWAENNGDKKRRLNRESYHRNQKKRLANSRLYFARRRKAVPPWLSSEQRREMEEIYLNCPVGYHVDHIIPLAGKNVCGLHVPWNLQYLPAKENMRKNNRI